MWIQSKTGVKKSKSLILLNSFVLVLMAWFIVCAPLYSGTQRGIIRVAIAANLAGVMELIKAEFEKDNPGTRVELVSGSSGKLTAQILEGAPFDLFASADTVYPQKLKDAGFVIKGPEVYVKGYLVIFSNAGVDLSGGIQVLASDKVKTIAIANPNVAPYGREAIAALQKAGIYERVKGKLVMAENISQTLQFALSSTDAAITGKSLLFSPAMRSKYAEGQYWKDIDPSLYSPLAQSMVVLKKGAGKADVLRFYDFVLSEKAKLIFSSYGYDTD